MKKFFYLSVLLASLVLTGCASTISTTVQRPAELDLHGAKSISVLPFQTSYYDDESSISILGFFRLVLNSVDSDSKQQITEYITSELTEELLNTGFMEVVGARRVETALEKNTRVPCDVYLTGYIAEFDNDIDEYWDEDEGAYYYKRHVDMKIVYEVIDSKTNRVISRKSQSYSNTSSSEWHRRDLPSPFRMVRSDLDSLVRQIMKQLQPYEEVKYLSLIDDKTKLPEMKTAKNLAKDGYLEMAEEMYETIYDDKGIYEAGYNAAILLEAMGKLEDAAELMEEVYFKTGERKAYYSLNDIKSEIESAGKLQKQLDKRNSN